MNDKGRPNNSTRLLWAVLLIISGSLAVISEPGHATGQEPAKGANQALLDEIKSVQASLAKLQIEIKHLRADFKAAEVRQEEATVKYVKSFAGIFLDSAMKKTYSDASDMLVTPYRKSDFNFRQQYVGQLYTGKGFDGAEWKSWSIDSEALAPNCKAMIVKGKFKGSFEKKDVTRVFVLRLVLEPDSGQWRVELYRVD